MVSLEPKRTLGVVATAIADKTAAVRAIMKANALSTCGIPKPYTYGDLTITIQEVAVERGLLRVIAKATVDGKGVFVDNPLYYQNPPILVPDGTFTTLAEIINGQEVPRQVANFKEDLPAALKEIVGQTIELGMKMAKQVR